MPRISASPTIMTEVKEAVASTTEEILRLSQGNHLEEAAVVRDLYDVLRAATRRVASVMNQASPTHQLPPELLTRIFDFTVDHWHGSEKYPKQIILLTHVCQHWRAVLISYPRIWSTVYMKPGDPNLISEWLSRSQKVPLTVIAEFTDTYDHLPCRYKDSATATLADNNYLGVCIRHDAVLSLDQLFPHRSRIRDLKLILHSSDPCWDDDEHDGEPKLLHHHFFKETLPSLQYLDVRAAHIEHDRYMIPVPDTLFSGKLPRLKELKYLGVVGGLMETARNLTSCEIGSWSESAGPTITSTEELRAFFDNNRTLEALTITQCLLDDSPIATLMTDLKFLMIDCFGWNLEKALSLIHAPQFKNLNTVQLSFRLSSLRVVATDGSGHTFRFSHFRLDEMRFHPLRYLGADIVTLHLDREITLKRLNDEPVLRGFFASLDAVQALEFDGAIADCVRDVLSGAEVFPRLKVLRVAVGRHDCEGTLQLLAAASKLRMEGGKPLATIEPLVAEGEGELDQEFCVEWEKCYKAKGMHSFLSG